MRRMLIPVLITAVLATPALALTSPHETTGRVNSWDAGARILTLDSGATYTLPAGTETAFVSGEKVHVIYHFTDGKNIASEANIVK